MSKLKKSLLNKLAKQEIKRSAVYKNNNGSEYGWYLLADNTKISIRLKKAKKHRGK